MIQKAFLIVGFALFTLTACNNKKANTTANDQKVEEVSVAQKTVDDVLHAGEAFVGKTVEVKGVVAHVCHHTGLRLFLKGTAEGDLLRVESTPKLGKLALTLEKQTVTVVGIVEEKRVDEAYLKAWEERAQKEPNDSNQCNTEKAAQHLSGMTTKDQIADFRKQIAERQEKEGKNFVSFYYLKALKVNK